MTAKQYVESIGTVMKGAQRQIWLDFVSAGESYYSVDWGASIRLAREFRCEQRQCFLNCGVIACTRMDLRYYEGYALNMIPVEHAWLIAPDGRIIDPTWSLLETDRVGDYFGMEIPLKYLLRSRRHRRPRREFEPRWVKVLQDRKQSKPLKK